MLGFERRRFVPVYLPRLWWVLFEQYASCSIRRLALLRVFLKSGARNYHAENRLGSVRTYYDTKRTADYSPYLVHFTKDRRFTAAHLIEQGDPLHSHLSASAIDKLRSILTTRTIYASPMPYLPNSPRAVSFTECIWPALVDLADQYSSYGLVFSKRVVFRAGGGPALYVRGDTLRALGPSIPPSIEPLIAPFDPEAVLVAGNVLDWLHEREWRLPGNLKFQDGDIEYLIVESIEDAQRIVEEFGTVRVPRGKIITMQVYRTIKTGLGCASTMTTFHPEVFSVGELFRWFKGDDLILQPKFQRRLSWSEEARAYLIDTIVRGMPMPKVYLRRGFFA